ncbi:unnamed protein product [Phytophthora lilii]|uniref:Unnamed protein product n=1 Tax=Phytophthora lilii TaxID=2077276 RepID=A0A9W6XEC6_9STRA|nr:unnamed protein product [Phytophthora lilii]
MCDTIDLATMDVIDLVSDSSCSDEERSDGSGQRSEAAGDRQRSDRDVLSVKARPIFDDPSRNVIDLTIGSSDGEVDEHRAETDVKLEAVASFLKRVRIYSERMKAHKRAKTKNNPWSGRLSRRRQYQAQRAPIKDLKRVYHAKTMQIQFIQKYLQVPGVREALQQLRARQEEEEKAPAHVVAAGAIASSIKTHKT